MDAKFQTKEFVSDGWCANIVDAHRLFQDNGTDPTTWQGMPFYGCAYLDTQERPPFAIMLGEAVDDVEPGKWLLTTWLEEWKEFHFLFMNGIGNKSLAMFLGTPWKLYDLIDLTAYQIRPIQELRDYNTRNYGRQYREYSFLAYRWARPDRREGARRRRMFVAHEQQKKNRGF